MAAAVAAPWEIREGEGTEAYEAFVLYLTMGPNRSGEKAGKALGKSTDLMSRWSAAHSWVSRALAWDAENNRMALETARQKRLDALSRHADVATALVAQAARQITPPTKTAGRNSRKLTEEERREWKAPADAIRAAGYALKEGHNVLRLTMGLPTQITRTQAESEEMVKKAVQAQEMAARIITEGLCTDDACECCNRVRAGLRQLHGFHRSIEREYVVPREMGG